MRRTLIYAAGLATLAIVANAGPVQAQQAENPRFVATASPHQSMTATVPQPSFSVLGAPVGIDAPVAPPYANSAFRNFAGQPATGNVTLGQVGGLTD